jgi:lysophospholipase L1-like esterase
MGVLSLGVACIVLGLTLASNACQAESRLRGGRILLLGDSLFDCHEGENRIEHRMQEKLTALRRGVKWEVVNLARGGMWIGPADATDVRGVAEPLFATETSGWYFEARKRCPKADVVVVEFSGNDGKVYSPEVFGQKLSALCDRVAKDYPGAKIVLATGMYLDPKHSAGYYQDVSRVEGFRMGESRNKYLHPYFEQTRRIAKQRGYALADLCARIKAETEAGNWDLRIRADESLDASKDAERPNDMHWFDNIHPNYHGLDVMADAVAKTILGENGLKPYSSQERK